MIASIVVGRGNKRTVIALPRDRDERIALGNKVKSLRLFPTRKDFVNAKARGAKAVQENRK